MKRFLTTTSVFALSAGLSLSALSLNAFAEGYKHSSSTTTTHTSSTSSTLNYGTVISTINNTPKELQELKALPNLLSTNVDLVNVGTLEKNNPALKNALDRNSADLTKLRAELQANETLKTKLQNSNVSLQNVVGIDVAGNKVIVYHQ